MKSRDKIQNLYEKLAPYAISKTQRMVGRWEVAEEIVHDVFCKLLVSNIIFENESMAYAWIYKASHNAAIDFLRAAKLRNHVLIDGPEAAKIENPTNIDPELIFQKRQHFHRILKLFKDSEAAIFAYYYIDDMSQQEVADLLQISRKTVERCIQNCVRLAKNLGEDIS